MSVYRLNMKKSMKISGNTEKVVDASSASKKDTHICMHCRKTVKLCQGAELQYFKHLERNLSCGAYIKRVGPSATSSGTPNIVMRNIKQSGEKHSSTTTRAEDVSSVRRIYRIRDVLELAIKGERIPCFQVNNSNRESSWEEVVVHASRS